MSPGNHSKNLGHRQFWVADAPLQERAGKNWQGVEMTGKEIRKLASYF